MEIPNYLYGINNKTFSKMKKIAKQELQEILTMDEQAREIWLKEHSAVIDFRAAYKLIEAEKNKALNKKRSDIHSELMAVKAHFEMWDKLYH